MNGLSLVAISPLSRSVNSCRLTGPATRSSSAGGGRLADNPLGTIPPKPTLPGTRPNYAPNFPRVEITHAALGRYAARGQLEGLHPVAEAEKLKPAPVRVSSAPRGKTWPRYDLCVQGAPPKRGSDEPDISRADFTWCMIAIDWGWDIESTAEELMQRSAKAQENGERYALLTAQDAAAAVERNRRGRGQA